MRMIEKLSTQYNDAVKQIKTAILQSQAKALKGVNQEQLALYYGIGRFISHNSREGFWGKGALLTISKQLIAEMPGLRGFSETNLKMMRIFYEEWENLETNSSVATDELQSADSEGNENQWNNVVYSHLLHFSNFRIIAKRLSNTMEGRFATSKFTRALLDFTRVRHFYLKDFPLPKNFFHHFYLIPQISILKCKLTVDNPPVTSLSTFKKYL